MFKYLILYALIAQSGTWAKPIQQRSDLASHVVIVTPQAQVHLDPAAKFAPFFHHLSPFARIAAPHDETILYVPASVSETVIPLDRQLEYISAKQQAPQIQQIQQAIMQGQEAASAAQAAAQAGFGQISEQFAEAAASLSPTNFFPQPAAAQIKDEKRFQGLKDNTQTLYPAAGRQFYVATGPVIPHIVDFVHTAPVLVGPVATTRSRNLKEPNPIPVVYVPLSDESNVEALQLRSILKRGVKEDGGVSEAEKATDFGRFLEANAIKPDAIKQEQTQEEQLKRDNLQASEQQDQPIAASEPEKAIPAQTELSQPQLKSILGAVGGDVSAVVVPGLGNSVVEDVAPQSKVA